MNLAASFVAYCVSGLSCPSFSAVPTSDLYCCVSCSSKTVGTVTQTFTYRFRSRSQSDFPLRLLELLPTVETKPVSHCRCVFRIVRPGETFSVPTHLPVQEFHRCQKTRTDAFAHFHLEHFTHQLFEIVRPVIWNVKDEVVSPSAHQVLPALRPSTSTAPPTFL